MGDFNKGRRRVILLREQVKSGPHNGIPYDCFLNLCHFHVLHHPENKGDPIPSKKSAAQDYRRVFSSSGSSFNARHASPSRSVY